ncbi:hypothetical protein SAMN06265370_102319 [Puniceibacterium sediminis]|uniref:Transposase InsH N-terminal domain-containing protein n=1 Tax=Puniceibacterium sediminis TaxID=1608407 RepID=A0A238VKH2_9RHOB|nr:hypothetical protein SAMN06265370_102319 [Puniceibacterium sediminis]
MMGSRQQAQSALFYEFSIETHVPADHMLRAVDRFVDLAGIRQHLAPFYSSTGRPSVDPELMICHPAGHCAAMSREGGCCWLATSWVSVRNVGCAKRSTGPSFSTEYEDSGRSRCFSLRGKPAIS